METITLKNGAKAKIIEKRGKYKDTPANRKLGRVGLSYTKQMYRIISAPTKRIGGALEEDMIDGGYNTIPPWKKPKDDPDRIEWEMNHPRKKPAMNKLMDGEDEMIEMRKRQARKMGEVWDRYDASPQALIDSINSNNAYYAKKGQKPNLEKVYQQYFERRAEAERRLKGGKVVALPDGREVGIMDERFLWKPNKLAMN